MDARRRVLLLVLVLTATALLFADQRSGIAKGDYPIPGSGFSDCPGADAPLGTHFPQVDVPVATNLKPYSVSYGQLDLAWSQVPAADGADCSIASNAGALPVMLNLPFLGPEQVASSVANAQLDFLSSQPSVPVCDWESVTSNCSLTPVGPNMVHWSTPGFHEQVGGFNVYSTGPLSFYAQAPSGDISSGLQSLELMIHKTLIAHLPQITSIGVVQEPPADVRVEDAAGQITGRTASGALALGIPHSHYFTNGAGYAAVVLMTPGRQKFTATAVGARGGKYSLSVSSLLPTVDGATHVKQETEAGTLGRLGTASVHFAPAVKGLIMFGPVTTIRASTHGHGVRVSYQAPQAHDSYGDRVRASCRPSSGSRFRIGTTVVRCAAQERPDPVARTTFKVVVRRVKTVVPVSHLRVSLRSERGRTLVGQPHEFTVVVADHGPDAARHVTTRFTASGRLEIMSAHARRDSCTNSMPVRCKLGTLRAGRHVTLRIAAVPLARGVLTTTATVNSASRDPDPAAARATVKTRVDRPRPRVTG